MQQNISDLGESIRKMGAKQIKIVLQPELRWKKKRVLL
jgi:hypothetical protein